MHSGVRRLAAVVGGSASSRWRWCWAWALRPCCCRTQLLGLPKPATMRMGWPESAASRMWPPSGAAFRRLCAERNGKNSGLSRRSGSPAMRTVHVRPAGHCRGHGRPGQRRSPCARASTSSAPGDRQVRWLRVPDGAVGLAASAQCVLTGPEAEHLPEHPRPGAHHPPDAYDDPVVSCLR